MQWNTILLDQHANVHASALVKGVKTIFSYEGLVCGGLAEEQMRLRPADGQNSVVWLIWHMTRCEDVAINCVLAGQPEVLDGDWRQQLRIDRKDIGTGMKPREVAELSERIDVTALQNYRLAVGLRTREVLAAVDVATLDQTVDSRHGWAAEVLGEHAGWVAGMWAQWRRRDFLYLVSGHCYQHWGEAITVRSLGGFPIGL
jgi:hypothetical protein